MSDIAALIDRNFDRFLSQLSDLLRFKSVGADPQCREQTHRCAAWLKDHVERLLGVSELVDAGGHPVVYGQTEQVATRPTVLLYGHYDVQPAEQADGWSGDPFSPSISEGKIVARGAADNKGPMMVYLTAVEMLRQLGPLPVNVKVMLEGEEESDGDAVFKFIEANRRRLKSDLIVSADAGSSPAGNPSICYGLRGLVFKRIDVTGANRDLHSGSFGGVVPNPAEALARLLTGLTDVDGKIAVPGLYEKVRPVDPDEREQLARLPFDADEWRRQFGLDELSGEKEFPPLQRLWCRPSFCINQLTCGYPGTVLPSTASALISVRIVPDQQGDEISQLLDRRIGELAEPTVKVKVSTLGVAEPWLGPRSGPAVDAACQASREAFGQPPVLVREGGSVPILSFLKRKLTENILVLGFTRSGCGVHGPNEHFHLDDIKRGIHTAALLLRRLGSA